MQDEFDQVIDCPLHQGMSFTLLKPLRDPSEIAPMAFSNCTLHEGRTGREAVSALVEWTEFLADHGSDTGHWIFRPGPGEEPDAEYTFKWVTAYSSYASLGHDFELNMNGGGSQRLEELIGRAISCDYPRMYNTWVIRQGDEE